ncbi:MAG: peptide chain release factor 3, partial [Clostridia bacterium]|nr:peptide chain release factor 3 [Clostridia bacterium]
DRIAFLRISSGKFERGQEYFHVQGGKPVKLSQPQQMMAESREGIEEAFAGDIIGVVDPGSFSIGDTICSKERKFAFDGIPTFAPEHFAMVEQIDSMKRKQFAKGMNQIAQEGAIRIFFEPGAGFERVTVGVIGVLQYDVLKFRMKSEYGVDYLHRDLSFQYIQRIAKCDVEPSRLNLASDTKWVQDVRGKDYLLFTGQWSIKWALDNNPSLELEDFDHMSV